MSMKAHACLRSALFACALVSTTGVAGQPPSTAGGRLFSTAELAARLNDPRLVVLHVVDRSSTFEQGHIPGARPIQYASVAVDGSDGLGAELPLMAELERVFEDAGVADTSHVVIYGATVPAARVFFTLDAAGHPQVALLDGGLKAWQAEGRPIATGAPASVTRGAWSPRLRAERMATAQWIQKEAGRFALVDVRPDDEFTGADGGIGGTHAAGHIDGARQLPWNTLVGSDGRFLPKDQLRAKLEAAGAAPGRPVVSYCMVGMRASVVYFVARHLGLDAKLYDGSIIDWGRRGLPTKRGR
jgi:thiosulfate/3-mercaptopyruvate sulfurtransferase